MRDSHSLLSAIQSHTVTMRRLEAGAATKGAAVLRNFESYLGFVGFGLYIHEVCELTKRL